MAIYNMEGDVTATTMVCHGPPHCTEDQMLAPVQCHWCHKIRGDDHRTPEEIDADIEEQQRGH